MKFPALTFRLRWLILSAWLLAAVGLLLFVRPPKDAASEPASFLPDKTLSNQAIAALQRAFPNNSGISSAVVIFERGSGAGGQLTPEDFQYMRDVTGRILVPSAHASAQVLRNVTLQSAAMLPLAPQDNPLVSPSGANGQAALIIVDVPANYITIRSSLIVEHLRQIMAQSPRPSGLEVAVTGSSGLGHDYAQAAKRSHQRTFRVTLAAVLVILLLVYRSPLAAIIPLAATSLAAVVAMRLLHGAAHFGLSVGTAENIFVIVLLYGAGVDYSLLLVSRCREGLDDGLSVAQAVGGAVRGTLSAIVAAAVTNIAALLMLCFAQYGIFRTTGPAVAIALAVALLSAVTLIPAMVAIFGRHAFWPSRRLGQIGTRRFWPRVARVVLDHPGLVLGVTLLSLAGPAWRGATLPWTYNTVASLKPAVVGGVGNGAEGMNMARRHWPEGEIAPVTVLVQSPKPLTETQWRSLSPQLSAAVEQAGPQGGCVQYVRSLSDPLGNKAAMPTNPLLRALTDSFVRDRYVSADATAMRFEAVLKCPAYSTLAMETVHDIRSQLIGEARRQGMQVQVHIAGATAEMMDTRTVTQRDFYIVAGLAMAVILLVVLALLRDGILAAFMVASTVLSYLATLGISYWVLVGLMGHGGMDWKVEIFLFVVMVAVGQDYNIFLAARLAQEARRLPPREAIAKALIYTGPVISSCGIIMAATLGSLMAGELNLLVQLGFAFALGMLIDTFVVRPLAMPAFVALTGRTASKSAVIG